jgi:RecJ-like exonuclease
MNYYTGGWSYLDLDELAAELRDMQNELDAPCDECGGDGEVTERCETCAGSGWFGPADIACTVCDGSGEITQTCAVCKGEGTVEGELLDRKRYEELNDLDNEIGLETCDDRQAIADYAFEEYAQQTAEDIGAISSDAQWPCNRIDWEAAANDLKQDYMSFNFEGTTYWVRAY